MVNIESFFHTEVLPLFRTLIQKACVNTGEPQSAQEIRSVEVLEEFFKRHGVECTRLELSPGRTNLVARIRGTQEAAPSLAYMGHLDVVPAKPEDWTHDPFGAEIHQGQVWGRGAVDMLCWTATQAAAFALAAAAGPYPGDLVYLALADEEAAGTWGARFLTRDHWETVKCDHMVTELGGFFLETPKGPAAAINLGEKGVCWLKLKATGTSGHGSMPYSMTNALEKAAAAMSKIRAWKPKLRRHGPYLTMAAAMGRTPLERLRLVTGLGEKGALAALARRNKGQARFLHTAGRTTVSPNLLKGGTKINIIPDSCELGLDIRFLSQDLPGAPDETQTPQRVIALVKKILGKDLAGDFDYEVLDFFPSTYSPPGGPLYQATKTILMKHHPKSNLMDMLIGGVTDGRFWREKGTKVYGFCLFDRDMTMDAYGQRIHGVDERISLTSLQKAFEYFLELPSIFWLSENTI